MQGLLSALMRELGGPKEGEESLDTMSLPPGHRVSQHLSEPAFFLEISESGYTLPCNPQVSTVLHE